MCLRPFKIRVCYRSIFIRAHTHFLTDRKGKAERRRHLLRCPAQVDAKVGKLHHERRFYRAGLRTCPCVRHCPRDVRKRAGEAKELLLQSC